MELAAIDPHQRWHLPPLILHPFSDPDSPDRLAESSRASLMLQGILPSDYSAIDALTRILLDGRYCEIRMLFYIGKDLRRWIDQCLDFAGRDKALKQAGLRAGSFAALLVDGAPRNVRDKLHGWGVTDCRSIFSRALGLNAVFAAVPEFGMLSEPFIRNYYRYADRFFECYQEISPFPRIETRNFPFDLYASGEYARLLDRQWKDS